MYLNKIKYLCKSKGSDFKSLNKFKNSNNKLISVILALATNSLKIIPNVTLSKFEHTTQMKLEYLCVFLFLHILG